MQRFRETLKPLLSWMHTHLHGKRPHAAGSEANKQNHLVPRDDAGIVTETEMLERACEALLNGEGSFRLLADAMPQIVWTAFPTGIGSYFNQRWYQYTGTKAGTPVAESWMAAVHSEDISRVYRIWKSALQSGSFFQAEYRIRENRSGLHRWHLAQAVAIRNRDGLITQWFGTCTDIHAQKEVEDELRVAQEKLLRSIDRLEFTLLEKTQDLSNALSQNKALLETVSHREKPSTGEP